MGARSEHRLILSMMPVSLITPKVIPAATYRKGRGGPAKVSDASINAALHNNGRHSDVTANISRATCCRGQMSKRMVRSSDASSIPRIECRFPPSR